MYTARVAQKGASVYSDAAKFRAMFDALERTTRPKSPAATGKAASGMCSLKRALRVPFKSPAAPGKAASGLSGIRYKAVSGISAPVPQAQKRDTHTHTHASI
jgi:hypothetical protein